eukprot:scaffold3290_cov259-Pinguiococcus_pyrenoidosus.AAC.15
MSEKSAARADTNYKIFPNDVHSIIQAATLQVATGYSHLPKGQQVLMYSFIHSVIRSSTRLLATSTSKCQRTPPRPRQRHVDRHHVGSGVPVSVMAFAGGASAFPISRSRARRTLLHRVELRLYFPQVQARPLRSLRASHVLVSPHIKVLALHDHHIFQPGMA